jgi:hypothetical protein
MKLCLGVGGYAHVTTYGTLCLMTLGSSVPEVVIWPLSGVSANDETAVAHISSAATARDMEPSDQISRKWQSLICELNPFVINVVQRPRKLRLSRKTEAWPPTKGSPSSLRSGGAQLRLTDIRSAQLKEPISAPCEVIECRVPLTSDSKKK